MKKLKFLSLTLLALFISILSFADATVNFPKEVNFIKMTATGVAVVGTNDALYGIDKDGKQLWKNEKLKKVDAERIEVLEGSELIYITTFRGFFLVNVFTGKLMGTEIGVIYGARVIHGVNQVWVIGKYNTIHVFDIATGTKLYKFEPYLPYGLSSTNQTDSQPKNFIGEQPITYTSEKTAILHIGSGQLGEYNLETGAAIWQFNWKPYKLKKPKDGKGDFPSIPRRGWAMMLLDNSTNTLYFPFRNMLIAVDSKSGKAKWDIKANKVSQILKMFDTDEGIVIHTAKGIDLIDKETGALKWDKPIKVKGSGGLLINDGSIFYLVAKKSIEKIDIANRKTTTITEKIKFEGGDSFTGFELIENSIVLHGTQNVVGVDKNTGEILFSSYYKAPGPSVGDIAKATALAGVAMTATMNSYNLNKQLGNTTYYQYTPAMQAANGTTTDTRNNLYISTKFKDADANGFGVAMVDKTNGNTKDKIVIGDRDPIYVVDENNGIIFYKSDKESITIKSLN